MSMVTNAAAPAARGQAAGSRSSVIMTAVLVLIVMSLVIPFPASFLDAGIALSIALATLILVMAALVDKPTDFQAFPLLLLVSLLLRLSLNVSSTRLILTQGHTGRDAAGHVISGFSDFVAGGSLLVGLTVFGVISVVNFMVITKGSGRMAEVAARFALDSLPGKQLAIDGDLNSGAIDHDTAKARRAQEGREISFFGSLDGASKFVKGDAIAGLVITLINLLVGLAVGSFSHGLPVSEALDTYAHLTIGDGLVSQIPALITSMAAALLLSRGGATDSTAELLSRQIIDNWRAPAVVAAAMAVLAAVPGLPTMLFLVLAASLAALAWRVATRPVAADAPDVEASASHHPAPSIGDVLDLDEIAVEIGSDLVAPALDEGRGLGARIANLRIHIARGYGVILPDIRITDAPELDCGDYVIRVHNVVRGRGTLRPHDVLALGDADILDAAGGDVARDPVYAAAARWLPAARQHEAAMLGATIVTPMEVLSTHLMEVARNCLPQLMSMAALQRMIAELKGLSDTRRAESYQRLFDSMVPDKVAPELLLAVLRLLLEERVSIRNLPLIVDAIAEARTADGPEAVCDLVRRRLRGQITQALTGDSGALEAVQMQPAWEAEFLRSEAPATRGTAASTLPLVARNLAEAVRALTERHAGRNFVLIAPDHRRRQIRAILAASGLDITVLGHEEIDPTAKLTLIDTLDAA